MTMTKEDYFFYEWLILSKGMDEEQFKQLTDIEFIKYKAEYKEFEKGLNKI